MKTNKKIAVISGVTGQDGSFLAEFLLSKGNYEVIGLKRRTSTTGTERIEHLLSDPSFVLEYFDLKDTTSIFNIVEKYKPDEFYNLAAMSHVHVSFDVSEDAVDSVALGPLRILNAIRMVSPKTKFYQASSSEMFGDNPDSPFDENSLLMPASPYACAKVMAHNLVRNYRKAYGLHASSGILCNHESERRSEMFVTRKITMAAAKIKLGIQSKLTLGNLDAYRDWGYAPDYVEAMWLMLQQEKPDDYVIATGETHSVKEFVELVFDIAELGDFKKYVEFDKSLLRPHEVPYLLGNYSKAKNKLGWAPKVKFKELAKIMYDSDFNSLKLSMK